MLTDTPWTKRSEVIIAWGCWYYGKFMKRVVLYPLWCLWHKIERLELSLYRHTIRIRRRWDTYMFKKERGGL
ncbi:hypothetical protein LCGC14_1530570 [marine sediment metagenome]|uniref:Uncharacterized protein n=1 Tax=marine sediment metagenome TaxID=412755 RepID=A0A0F9IVX9_9ZZZZ